MIHPDNDDDDDEEEEEEEFIDRQSAAEALQAWAVVARDMLTEEGVDDCSNRTCGSSAGGLLACSRHAAHSVFQFDVAMCTAPGAWHAFRFLGDRIRANAIDAPRRAHVH